MSFFLPQWAAMILLFFLLLPLAALCTVTIVRFIYRKIKNRKTITTSKFIIVLLVFLLGIAIIPPVSYIIVESSQTDVMITGKIAYLSYDDKDPNIRYIDFDGKRYQELDTSISETEYYDYSEDAELKYGAPVANVVFANQSLMERYIYTIFRYPVHSQIIYPLENKDMGDYISLEGTGLFCETGALDKKIEYYSDTANYDYFVEDYNENNYYDLEIDQDSIDEIRYLAHLKNEFEYEETEDSIEKTIPGIVKLEVDSDYNMFTVIGESNDLLLLREIGAIYIDKDGRMYQVVEEMWRDDGSVALLVLQISDETSEKLDKAFRAAGITVK